VFSVVERMRGTLFALVGIAVGIAAVVATVGTASSAGASVLMGLDTVEARTITAQPAPNVGSSTVLPRAALDATEALPGVAAAGVYASTGEVVARTLPPWYDVLGGTTLQTYEVTLGLQTACSSVILAGRWFTEDDTALGRVVLGASAAVALGVDRVGDGRTVFLGDDVHEVIGVLRVPATTPLSNAILMLSEDGADGGPPISALLVQAEPGWGRAVSHALSVLLDPNRTGSITISTPVDYAAVQQRIQGDVNGLYVVLGGISMLVGAIGIANTRLMAVYERSVEIGLRRSLGATRGNIMLQFALESAILGLLGGLLGAASGVMTVVAIALTHRWPPVLMIWIPLAGPLIGLGIGTLAGLYPAIRAARVEPVSALRGGG
jgi:putative ABC transport system permease protein